LQPCVREKGFQRRRPFVAFEGLFGPADVVQDETARSVPAGRKKLVIQQRGKCGVTRQAQLPRRSFGKLAEGGALPRRMELPGPTSGAVASD
jgi:hypothetical protein